MLIITKNDLQKIRCENIHRKIVLCSGYYDLFHIGHLKFLKKAKAQGDILVVNLRNDLEGRQIKGKNRPIINHKQRLEIINSLKFVDYVVLSEIDDLKFKDKEDLLWKKYIPIIDALNPDILFAIKETFRESTIPKHLKKKNITLKYTKRCEGVSTTYIVNKIKNINTDIIFKCQECGHNLFVNKNEINNKTMTGLLHENCPYCNKNTYWILGREGNYEEEHNSFKKCK